MEREYQLLKKIHPVFSLAPKPLLYASDASIMDKHFYVMERKKGIILDDKLPKELLKKEKIGETISAPVVDTLVQLLSIDYKEAGLHNIRKPDGYLER